MDKRKCKKPSNGQNVLIYCKGQLDQSDFMMIESIIKRGNITSKKMISDLYDPVSLAVYRGDLDCYLVPDSDSPHGVVAITGVTHWMELPYPPTEK